MIYWTNKNIFSGYTFSETLWFWIDRNLFFYYVLPKSAFNKHRILKIDSATSNGNHGKYIFDSFGLRWRQHVTIGGLHEHCIAAEYTDCTRTVLIPRIKLFSSAPNFFFRCAEHDFRSEIFAMIINNVQGSTLWRFEVYPTAFFPPIASFMQHCTDPLHLTTSPLLFAYKGAPTTYRKWERQILLSINALKFLIK